MAPSRARGYVWGAIAAIQGRIHEASIRNLDPDEDRLSDEEYFEEVDSLEAGLDGLFEGDAIFGAESAKAGIQVFADEISAYADTLDDLNPPEDINDQHDAVQNAADDLDALADETSEDVPVEEVEGILFSDPELFSEVEAATVDLCEYADEQEIAADALCADAGEPPADPSTLPAEETTEVLIEDFNFQPAHIQVAVGDTVTFTQGADGAPHTATADAGSFDTGTLTDEGESGEATFDTAGEFSYFCEIHPEMLGLVTVVE
ncbi:MAG: cupredoxin family copper-binding protein [Dehalococcoidia bacterium]